MTSQPGNRLPRTVVPQRYELVLEPDLGAATFVGRVLITVDVVEPIDTIVCNAAELEISDVVVRSGDQEWSPLIELDPDIERLVLATPESVPAGPAQIEITFAGILNDRLRGFYRSTYSDDDDTVHTIATTQFQSTDARRCFPCWDEPEWKASFETTLIVDSDHLAVSNTAEVENRPLPDGRRQVRFAPTMVMSTYLVAFVVGPLVATTPVESRGIPVRIIHRPGQGHLTEFALDVAIHALEWLADYYAIPYPSDKVDLVAIPDFAAGAMENLGCITFRDLLLLIDPDTSSQPELQRVADVINHELAHMWFGDLVTMRWWEGIWLNEAFATFMEVSCTDAYRPDWQVWNTFARARAAAFDVDGLASTRAIEYPVNSPADAEAMFDVLTYEKGAAVVRMLEQHLGPVVFRDGVRSYLSTHAYSNTETSDLWESLEATSGQPVRTMMTSWIFQGGYPVIDATQTVHGLRIEQSHFTLDPSVSDDRTWAVPLKIKGPAGEESVLAARRSTLLTGVSGPILTVNAGGCGFFRSRLDRPSTDAGTPSSLGSLTAAERHAVADDGWALTLNGDLTAAQYLELATGFASEHDLSVWQALATGLRGLTRLVDDDTLPTLKRALAAIVGPSLNGLGLDPDQADDDRRAELRATLIRLMGAVAEDPATIDAARARLHHPDPTISAASLTVVAHNGTEDDFERVRQGWLEADDPQAEIRNLRALVDFPSEELVDRVLADIDRGKVRTQDVPQLLGRAMANRHAGQATWAYVTTNWDELIARLPSHSMPRILGGVVALDTSDDVDRVARFVADHPVPEAGLQIDQHLERQRINAAVRTRELPRFGRSLSSNRSLMALHSSTDS